MITSDLVSYIQSQIKKNISKDLIILHLSESGWKKEDIDEGFLKVSSISDLNFSPTKPEVKDKWLNDPYRESPIAEVAPIVKPVVGINELSKKIEEQKAWGPVWVKPVSQIKTEAPVKIEEPRKFIYSVPEIKKEIPTKMEEKKAFTLAEIKPTAPQVPEVKIEVPVKIEMPIKTEAPVKIEEPRKFIYSVPEIKKEIPIKVEEKKILTPVEIKLATPYVPPVKIEMPIKTEAPVKIEEPRKFIYSVPEIKKETPIKIEDQKIWSPIASKPITSSVVEAKVEAPKKVEESKIWTPMNIKPIISSIPEIKKETPKEEIKTTELEILPEEISSGTISKINNELPSFGSFKNEVSVINQEPLSGHVLSAVSFNQPKKSFSDFKANTSDSIPTISNLSSEKPIFQVPIKLFSNIAPVIPVTSIPEVENKVIIEDNNPESAIISSFRQDIDAAKSSKNNNLNKVNKKSKINFKILAIIFVILLIVGGLVFAVVGGYIKIPISIIKNDPKIILLNTSSNFDKLKSYKTNTEITLSSPSFANITSGLVNGEAVISNDRDYISVNTLGSINKNDSNPPIFDYNTTIKGSFIKNDIVADIKYDSSNSYIKMPDFSDIVDNYSSSEKEVLIPSGQLSLIASEFPPYFKDKINKIGTFDILSNIMAHSFADKFALSFNELINSSTMAEKANETINGQDTYHYSIIVDHQNTKKFLVALLNTFATNISPDVKSILEENLGSTTLDSFEIWIGKIDSNILQYKFKLSAPLSKVIGLDDKGIANNIVSLDWKTTYSDFDVANEIIIPTDYMRIEDYMNDVHNNKIKSTLSSFSSNAKNLFNAEGSFGKSINKTGSCTAPDSGSLFSPLGHDNGANTAIASISSNMNDLLALSAGPSVCFSTLKAWAISSPLVSNPQVFFCVDNTGNSNIVTTQPTSTTCVVPVTNPNTTNPVNMPVIKSGTPPVSLPTIPAIKPTTLPIVPTPTPTPTQPVVLPPVPTPTM